MVFHSGCTNFHFNSGIYTTLLFSWYSPAHIIFRCLDGGHAALTCISMMVGGVEHLFVYLLTFWMSSLEKKDVSLVVLPFLKSECSAYVSFDIFWIRTLYPIYGLQILPFCRLPFHFASYFFCSTEGFWFDAVPHVGVCFSCL